MNSFVENYNQENASNIINDQLSLKVLNYINLQIDLTNEVNQLKVDQIKNCKKTTVKKCNEYIDETEIKIENIEKENGIILNGIELFQKKLKHFAWYCHVFI